MPTSFRVASRANESRASRVQARRRRSRAVELTGRGLALAILAGTALGQAAENATVGLVSPLPAGVATPALWLTMLAGMAALVYAGGAVALAVVRLSTPDRSERQDRTESHSPGDEGPTRASRLPTLAAFVAACVVAGLVVRLAAGLAGDAWWVVAAVVMSGGGVLALHASPRLVAFALGARPLADRETVERLERLSCTAGVEVAAMQVVPAGASTSTAFVAGFGDRRTIFLASEVVRDWKSGEVDVVVAHELGHHRRGDLWRSMVVDALVLAFGLAVSASAVQAGWLDAPATGAAAMPAIALVTWAGWLASAPFRFALSRHQERQADAFALTLTGQVEAFVAVIRRLGKIHLADERPSAVVRWMTCRHPTVPERLAAAEAFRRARR